MFPSHEAPAPAELQSRPQWVCWRKEERKGKPTKVPYNPHTGSFARSDDPGTWASFPIARQAHERSLTRRRPYDGIGSMFHRDYTGIDLDHCVNADGSIDPWAQAYLERLPSYTEYSPSKTGIHILVRGAIPSGTRRAVPGASHPQAAIELYCEHRSFTVTGNHLKRTRTTIEAYPELGAIHAEITASPPARKERQAAGHHQERDSSLTERSDDALLERAMHARNGAAFRALWDGNTSAYPSQSEAELALCNLLAFWTSKDGQWMDRLFRRSGLFRPEKWERAARSGEMYGEGAIARPSPDVTRRTVLRERARSSTSGVAMPPLLRSRRCSRCSCLKQSWTLW